MSIKGEEAIGYVRVSTVRQVEEGNSIQSQIEDVRNYAKSRGLILRSRNIVIANVQYRFNDLKNQSILSCQLIPNRSSTQEKYFEKP